MDPGVEIELAAALDHPIIVDITTTGRRSGLPRRIEIWMVNIDGRLVIGGTPGRRDWFANLLADPHLTVHFKSPSHTDVEATANLVTDPAFRRRIYEHRSTEWYRQQTPVDDLIAAGPTVELTLRKAS